MKKFITLCMASVFMLSASVNAQDNRSSGSETSQQQMVIKERYEQRKQAIMDAYKRDIDALNAQTGLTSEQRREQRRIIQERFNRQKRENQEAYKADKKALQAQRKSDVNDRDDVRDDKMKKGKPAVKENKAKNADKARKNDKAMKGQKMANQAKSKGKRN